MRGGRGGGWSRGRGGRGRSGGGRGGLSPQSHKVAAHADSCQPRHRVQTACCRGRRSAGRTRRRRARGSPTTTSGAWTSRRTRWAQLAAKAGWAGDWLKQWQVLWVAVGPGLLAALRALHTRRTPPPLLPCCAAVGAREEGRHGAGRAHQLWPGHPQEARGAVWGRDGPGGPGAAGQAERVGRAQQGGVKGRRAGGCRPIRAVAGAVPEAQRPAPASYNSARCSRRSSTPPRVSALPAHLQSPMPACMRSAPAVLCRRATSSTASSSTSCTSSTLRAGGGGQVAYTCWHSCCACAWQAGAGHVLSPWNPWRRSDGRGKTDNRGCTVWF